MTKADPVVYLLHGDDEFAMTQVVAKMQAKLGDPATAEMNITRIDGRSLALNDLRNVTSAMPFLADRRLVILSQPAGKLKSERDRDAFRKIMEGLPPSTALVILENKKLKGNSWLLNWVGKNKERVFVKLCEKPKGGAMIRWILDHVKEVDGEITHQAAGLLAELVGGDTRTASLEINKLMSYVNCQRAIEVEDVESLVALVAGHGEYYFALIDALAQREGRQAMDLLYKLLDQQPTLLLFHSLVGQFRMLLLTREALEGGGGDQRVADKLSIHPYRAKKLAEHARRLELSMLEDLMRQMLDLDEKIKTGQIEAELALETLVASLTSQPV